MLRCQGEGGVAWWVGGAWERREGLGGWPWEERISNTCNGQQRRRGNQQEYMLHRAAHAGSNIGDDRRSTRFCQAPAGAEMNKHRISRFTCSCTPVELPRRACAAPHVPWHCKADDTKTMALVCMQTEVPSGVTKPKNSIVDTGLGSSTLLCSIARVRPPEPGGIQRT
jgi:hypothetical protein